MIYQMLCGTEPFPETFRAKKYKLHSNFFTKKDFFHVMLNLPVEVSVTYEFQTIFKCFSVSLTSTTFSLEIAYFKIILASPTYWRHLLSERLSLVPNLSWVCLSKVSEVDIEEMFTYADQVGKKIKEDKIQKNIKAVYLCTSGWKKSKKTKYKKIYIKNVYIRRTGWQKSYRSLKFGPNPPKRPDLAEFGTLVAPRGKKIFAICFLGSD